MKEAVNQGKISQAMLDERGEVLSVKFRLEAFDEPFVLDPKATEIVHNQAGGQFGIRCSTTDSGFAEKPEQSLPLKDFAGKKVAIIGPNAKEKKSLLSRYGPVHTHAVTIFDGLSQSLTGAEILMQKAVNILTQNFRKVISGISH